uniref:MOB kinase activator-like 2 n=1 Tax=Musca domestica TaxID=7370 RepID=T1PEK0_MUSDO
MKDIDVNASITADSISVDTTATSLSSNTNNSNNNNNNCIKNNNNHNTKPAAATATANATTTNNTTSTSSPTNSSTSFVYKCLIKTVRFMWQVTALPTKIGETIGTLYRYAQTSVDTILCVAGKARRKERDGDQNSTDTKLYLEESVLERKLPEADLKALVDLPAGLDYNEWLASHTLALFEHVNLVYGTISEFCTTSGCPDMTGPGNRTYLWFDEKGKKTRVAAPQYIDYVMTFTQKTVSDESIFPTKYANEFPSSFESIARKILRLQFHVIAHLYAAHFREIALLGLHTHLNLTFAHLTALHRRFNLIDEKETDVLRDLEVALRLTDDTTSSAGGGDGSSQSESGGSIMSSSTAAGDSGKQCGEDVNSVQHNNIATSASLIDGGGPICTQPEAGTKSQQFGVGGGGGLIGGILGDLSSGEFGDTMHYCTSAVPASSTNCSVTNPLQNTTPSSCNSMNGTCSAADGGGGGGGVTANGNNGAGAFHQHNNNNHVTQHHHHHHPHHHHAVHHHHHHPNHFAQNTGLIQCNASNAPTATAATTSTTTA